MAPKVAPKSAAKDDMDEAQAVKNKKTPKKVGSDDDEDEEDFDDEEEDLEDEDEEDIDEDDEDFDDENEADDSKVGKSVINLRKTLFIKNLPESTTEADIKALSPDILEVRIDVSHLKGEKNPKYAILDFVDGDAAARTLEQLKGKPVNGADVVIDFISGKTSSSTSYTLPANSPSDLCKLYVTGFGRDITVELLKQMFPTSNDISLPLNPKDGNKPLGYAFIHYTDEGVCKAAHDAMQDHVYQSRTLVVMYGKKSSLEADKSGKRSQPPPRRGRPPKKPRVEEVKEDEEDDEEDEDEEDEEDDEEDEEEEDEDN